MGICKKTYAVWILNSMYIEIVFKYCILRVLKPSVIKVFLKCLQSVFKAHGYACPITRTDTDILHTRRQRQRYSLDQILAVTKLHDISLARQATRVYMTFSGKYAFYPVFVPQAHMPTLFAKKYANCSQLYCCAFRNLPFSQYLPEWLKVPTKELRNVQMRKTYSYYYSLHSYPRISKVFVYQMRVRSVKRKCVVSSEWSQINQRIFMKMYIKSKTDWKQQYDNVPNLLANSNPHLIFV